VDRQIAATVTRYNRERLQYKAIPPNTLPFRQIYRGFFEISFQALPNACNLTNLNTVLLCDDTWRKWKQPGCSGLIHRSRNYISKPGLFKPCRKCLHVARRRTSPSRCIHSRAVYHCCAFSPCSLCCSSQCFRHQPLRC